MPARPNCLVRGRTRGHPARGFTLIEQLAALTLAATASATALPVLAEFQSEGRSAALHSLAASATSAGVLNQAGCLVTQQVPTSGKCQPIADCQAVAGLLMLELPTGHRILPGALGSGANGVEGACTLQRGDGATAAFRGVSAGL